MGDQDSRPRYFLWGTVACCYTPSRPFRGLSVSVMVPNWFAFVAALTALVLGREEQGGVC